MYLNFSSSYLRFDAKGRKRKQKKQTGPSKYSRAFEVYKPKLSYAEECAMKNREIKSAEITSHSCSRKETPEYTGTLIIGIATLHKSNAVPVIDKEQATDIARMRR